MDITVVSVSLREKRRRRISVLTGLWSEEEQRELIPGLNAYIWQWYGNINSGSDTRTPGMGHCWGETRRVHLKSRVSFGQSAAPWPASAPESSAQESSSPVGSRAVLQTVCSDGMKDQSQPPQPFTIKPILLNFCLLHTSEYVRYRHIRSKYVVRSLSIRAGIH